MPTYEYACKSCGEHLEVVQSFRDDALTTCPNCQGELRKVFGAIGIAFKGSGFYKTDSRDSSSSKAKPKAKPDSDGKAKDKDKVEPASSKKGDTAGSGPKKGDSPKAAASS